MKTAVASIDDHSSVSGSTYHSYVINTMKAKALICMSYIVHIIKCILYTVIYTVCEGLYSVCTHILCWERLDALKGTETGLSVYEPNMVLNGSNVSSSVPLNG